MNLSRREEIKILTENVIVTTICFEKILQKIISHLTNEGFDAEDPSKKWIVKYYFYRIEFQARGSPHAHLLLWLEDQDGNEAPSLMTEESTVEQLNNAQQEDKVKQLHNDLISCKGDARCSDHKKEDNNSDCSKCTELKHLVKNFQTHKCTFSCQKKRKEL